LKMDTNSLFYIEKKSTRGARNFNAWAARFRKELI
jgi:hypothetical protein